MAKELVQVCRVRRMGPASLYLLIPDDVVEELQIQEGESFKLFTAGRTLVYEPTESRPAPQPTPQVVEVPAQC